MKSSYVWMKLGRQGEAGAVPVGAGTQRIVRASRGT